MDFIKIFMESMSHHKIITDEAIIPDGKLHRAHIQGDRLGTRNCWYTLHLDGLPCGVFGDWKSGVTHKWCAKSLATMSPAEIVEQHLKIKEIQRQREDAQRVEQHRAAKLAQEIWMNAKPANPNHPYLRSKNIPPFIARQKNNYLVLPVIDFDRRIWSLQFIYFDGSKKLLSGGAKKTRFIPVNSISNTETLLICEGFATGCSLAKVSPQASVIAAVDAGNLEAVAILARQHFPKSKIIICADDDRETIGNPGVTKGRKAAIAANASFVTPIWPEGAPISLSDFNDLASWIYHSNAGVLTCKN